MRMKITSYTACLITRDLASCEFVELEKNIVLKLEVERILDADIEKSLL